MTLTENEEGQNSTENGTVVTPREKLPKWLTRFNNPQEGDRELLHIALTRDYWKGWQKALEAYLKDPRDFHSAEWFLGYHPANQRHGWDTPESWWHQNLDWYVTKVDPHTNRIEDDKKRNVKTAVWVEWGPWHEHGEDPEHTPVDGIGSHDYRVDTGGDTFEQAIVNLAHNVWKLYGAEAEPKDGAKLRGEDRW